VHAEHVVDLVPTVESEGLIDWKWVSLIAFIPGRNASCQSGILRETRFDGCNSEMPTTLRHVCRWNGKTEQEDGSADGVTDGACTPDSQRTREQQRTQERAEAPQGRTTQAKPTAESKRHGGKGHFGGPQKKASM